MQILSASPNHFLSLISVKFKDEHWILIFLFSWLSASWSVEQWKQSFKVMIWMLNIKKILIYCYCCMFWKLSDHLKMVTQNHMVAKLVMWLLKSTLIKLASFEMSHFQVAFYLFFRTSSGAQPYTYGDEFDLQDKWTCIKNSFHWEVVHHQDSLFETEVTGTWKWLIVKLNFKLKVHSWSLCHFAIIEICWSQHLE